MTSSVEVDTVLVPVDGSEESTRAAEYAVAIAERYGATLKVMYVLGEEVVRAIRSGAIEGEVVAEETRLYTDDVKDLASAAGVPCNTMIASGYDEARITQHPGSVILDTAEAIDADFLVIPREPTTGEPGEVLEKAAEYVLLYASQPVLSV